MTAEQLEAGLATAYRTFYSKRRRCTASANCQGRETVFHMALTAAN